MGRLFGHIDGVSEGDIFSSREDLANKRVHKPIQAGISGSQHEGADSIVVSGGYEDDEDHGDTIIYTGHGGRDGKTGRQIADQQFGRGNKALAANKSLGLPVRVVRGTNKESAFSPDSGYRYDGLFRVQSYWQERGKSGFKVWRFRLEKEELSIAVPEKRSAHESKPVRIYQTTLRIVRDTELCRRIKKLYDYACQICGVRLKGPASPYAEAAHIRPLGRPHDGPDNLNNILCLCPNHHVLFDLGSFSINDNLTCNGIPGRLKVHKHHKISIDHIRYHRDHCVTYES